MSAPELLSKLTVLIPGGPQLPVVTSQTAFYYRLGTIKMRRGDTAFIMLSSSRRFKAELEGEIEQKTDGMPLPEGASLFVVGWNDLIRSGRFGSGMVRIDDVEEGGMPMLLNIELGEPELIMKPEDPGLQNVLLDTSDPYEAHELDAHTPCPPYQPDPAEASSELKGELLRSGWFGDIDEIGPDDLSITGELLDGEHFSFVFDDRKARLVISEHRPPGWTKAVIAALTILVAVVVLFRPDAAVNLAGWSVRLAVPLVIGLTFVSLGLMAFGFHRPKHGVTQRYSTPLDEGRPLTEQRLDKLMALAALHRSRAA